MKYMNRWTVIVLIVAGMILSACGPRAAEEATTEDGPAKIEHLDGAQPTRVTLTEEAAKRLDIQTVPVQGTTIPYSAVLYDTEGKTWIYLNTAPLTFLRSPVTVDHIDGNQAFLSKELPADSKVVTLGAEELYGSETEFEEE